MSEESLLVDSFFRITIRGMVIPDLRRLRNEIRPDAKGGRGCTAPTAMLAFSILDVIGYLIRDASDAKRKQTSRNIAFCLSHEAGLFPKEYADHSKLLVNLFRHGLMHQVFPKACGIAKMPDSSPRPLVFLAGDGIPVLNVDRLVDDLLAALRTLELRVKKQEHHPLAKRMEERIGLLEKQDCAQLEKMRGKRLLNHLGQT